MSDARFREVLRLATPPMLALCLPVAFLLWPFSADIIRVLASEEFVALSTTPLDLLWIAAAVALLTTVISPALVAVHAQGLLARLNTVNLLLNLALNLVLIPRYGANGAAVALICSEFSGLLVCVVVLSRRLRGFVPLRESLLLLGCLIVALAFERLIGVLWWPARGLLVAAAFFGLAYLTRAVVPASLKELSGATTETDAEPGMRESDGFEPR